VTAVEDEAVCVDNGGRSHPVRIAPDRWAGASAGTTENTFCSLVVDRALRWTLQAFGAWLVVVIDEVRLDRLISFKEAIHIYDQIFDDRIAKHCFDGDFVTYVTHEPLTGQTVAPINTHSVRATDTVCTGTAIG